MDASVSTYIQSLTHALVKTAVLQADFSVKFQVVYGEDLQAKVEVGPVLNNHKSDRKSRRKAEQYREILREKDEEIVKLKEELRKMKSPVSTPNSEKSYKINLSGQVSPLAQSTAPRTIFSRKSSWEQTTQTDNPVSRHVNTPSLVDANVQVEEVKPKRGKRKLKIEDDSSEDDGKETTISHSLHLSNRVTEAEFTTTAKFTKSEMYTQTDLHQESKREIEISIPNSPNKQDEYTEMEGKTGLVVNIEVSAAPPLLNKLRRLEKTKRSKRKRQSPTMEKPPVVPRPQSEAPKRRPKPPMSLHSTKVSVSTRSSKTESERQQHSLRSTLPSASDPEDPAVRQNLMKYLQTHQFKVVRPVTVQSNRGVTAGKGRKLRPVKRPPTPITELLYTGLYSDQNSWKNVVQVLRDNPSLLSKFISPPVNEGQLPAIVSPAQERSTSASTRVAAMSRNGRTYRVYTPGSDLVSPRPQTRDSHFQPTPSPGLRSHSRGKEKPVKDWSLSHLDEDVGNGHYNFNWQKDPSLYLKSEIVSIIKALEDGKELPELGEIQHKAIRTLRKLQVDLMLTETGGYAGVTTVPGVLALLQECTRLLRLRQVTISVLHYLHQREEALLNALTDSADGGEAIVQQLSKLLSQALSTWRLVFPGSSEFIYLGKDYLEEDYLDGHIQAEDLRH